MKYRVFDSESRQFNNVPIQPMSNFHWPPQEEKPHDFLDEQDYEETQDSDNIDQQPCDTEDATEKECEQKVEEIEITDDQDPPESMSCTIRFVWIELMSHRPITWRRSWSRSQC